MGQRLSELLTPCLVLEGGKLERNIQRMAGRAEELGVSLRPHVKTCKSAAIAALLAPARSCITVSTLQEAEYFAREGFRDIMYAVSIVPAKLEKIAQLNAQGAHVQVILDNLATARQLADSAKQRGVCFPAWIEIDVDGHRAGLEPRDPLLIEIGQFLQDSEGTALMGVMTHAGESYECHSTQELEKHAELERRLCVQAADSLRSKGIMCPRVSVGSTPTALSAKSLQGVNELRAGVYVFFDLFQAGLGVCSLDDIALSVLTTVVSHKTSHRRLIIDAGGLALSKDRGTASQAIDCGYGLVLRAESGKLIPGLQVVAANQEHGMIDLPAGFQFDQFPVGSQLRILPNHACMTAAAHGHYNVVDGDDLIIDRWQRCNGW
ncbi:MAG: alanine racemase [Xanthomonadales bacterium]|jgi:D-serine deaminase-like pyridoxal phosphate-dependent protein|nr:alanine racemase [Xanthomonadales bacterium]